MKTNNQIPKDISEYFKSSGKSYFRGVITGEKEDKKDNSIFTITSYENEYSDSEYFIHLPLTSEYIHINNITLICECYQIYIDFKNEEQVFSPDINIIYSGMYNNMHISIYSYEGIWLPIPDYLRKPLR